MFARMAEAAGLPRKQMYTLSEASEATGIPYGTLYRSAVDGSLETFLAPGSRRGRKVRPEWMDEWLESGLSGGGDR